MHIFGDEHMASKIKYALATAIVLTAASGAFAADLAPPPPSPQPFVQRGGLEVASGLLFGESSKYDPTANLAWPSFSGFRRASKPPRSIDGGDDRPKSVSGIDWSEPTPRFLIRADDSNINVRRAFPRIIR